MAEAPRVTLAALLGCLPADALAALQQVANAARDRAFVVLPLGVQPATDARELASLHAAIALQSVRYGRPMAPTVLLSAGPVLRDGNPAGAADFLLALALALDENPLIHAGACHAGHPDTAGDPDPVDTAASMRPSGFYVGPDTVQRSRAAGLQPGALLVRGDAQDFFAALADTFAATADAGPVMRAVLICMD